MHHSSVAAPIVTQLSESKSFAAGLGEALGSGFTTRTGSGAAIGTGSGAVRGKVCPSPPGNAISDDPHEQMVSGQLVAHVAMHHSSVADKVTDLQLLESSATNKFGMSGDGAVRPARTRANMGRRGTKRRTNK